MIIVNLAEYKWQKQVIVVNNEKSHYNLVFIINNGNKSYNYRLEAITEKHSNNKNELRFSKNKLWQLG